MQYKIFVNNCLVQNTDSAQNTAVLFEFYRDYKSYVVQDVKTENNTTSYYFIAK